jgi:hypothetical protein
MKYKKRVARLRARIEDFDKSKNGARQKPGSFNK